MHAATVFGDLQSFMRQELDQAVATQALWQALSSRQRVSSRPEGRSGGAAGSLELLAILSVPQCTQLEAGGWLNQAAVRLLCPAILTHLLSASWDRP